MLIFRLLKEVRYKENIMKNKLGEIFIKITQYISYILNDSQLILSPNYFECLNNIYTILTKACCKIEKEYYKYVLRPNLCNIPL